MNTQKNNSVKIQYLSTLMKKRLFLLCSFILSQSLFAQATTPDQNNFPSDYGVFSIPLWSKVVLELKETQESKYEYRIISMEPYETFYSFDKAEELFDKNPKENTVELYFIGAYHNEGKEDKDYNTLLKIRNNLKKPLSYKADIKYYFKDDFENTSIIGAFPGTNTLETWPQKIDFIALYNFENWDMNTELPQNEKKE